MSDSILAVTSPDCINLPEGICKSLGPNFETLKRAFAQGNIALMECRLRATRETVAAIVAITNDGKEFHTVPFAVMLCGNNYELLDPPDPDGGFFSTEEDSQDPVLT